jgi:hypothetical protein
MPLFAKNKPTERVDFEGGYVEVQHLSKGIKDEISRRTTEMYADLPQSVIKQLRTNPNATDADVPPEILGTIGKIMDIEYYKLAHAIKSWSDDAPINEETVKEMDEDIFLKVSKKVDEMNELTTVQRKN